MSFYGSVYYQLVDTFYKIVAKNSTARNFGPVEYPTEDLETQAIGRKGILSLNAGNKWIGFDQIKDAQGDPTGQGYMIYHAPADNDPASATQCHGFSCQDDLEMDENGVLQLTEGSVFETNSYLVDAAGHIIPDVSVKYKLPKTETNDRLNALESWKDQLFWLINGTMPDQPEDMDAFKEENPREENHADRISAGEGYDEIVRQIYTKSDRSGDSAEETAKVFFGEDDWSDDDGKARSFVDAFGSIRDIKEEVFGREYAEEHSEDYTVAEAIIKIKGEVDKNADNIETNLQSATQTHVTINNELTDHDNRINNIVRMYGKTNFNAGNPEDPETIRKATSEHYFGRNALDGDGVYRNFIDGFGSIDQVITSVFHTNNYDSSTTVSNAIATLAGNAETLRGEFDILETRVGLDDNSGLSKRIATNEADIKAIEDDLGPATKEGSVRHTLVQLATADSTLDGKISTLGTRHDNELEAIRKSISDNTKAIEDEATARDGAIAQAIAAEVTARDGAIAQAIVTEVTARDGAITQAIAAENLGDLRAKVGQNNTDIGTINTQLTGENGIVGQISGINGQIINLNSNKVETSTFEAFKTTNSSEIDKKLDISTFTAFTQELNTNLESYAQKGDLESYSLKSDLENYILKSDYEAKIATYDETIAKLLERLEALEAIHPELTPDPNPEVPDSGESPDPETPENGENTEPEIPEGEDEGSTTV